jgi:hypothetical protein
MGDFVWRSINYMGYPYFFSEFQCSSLDYMPVPHPRRELLPDGAFKETAKYYLELLREKNPEAFDSLHEKILEWKSKKRPSEFPDLLRDFAKDLNPEKDYLEEIANALGFRDFAKDLNPEKDYLEEIAHALKEYFSKIHKENGYPFTLQIDENKIENEEDKIVLLGAAKCLNEKYEKGLDKFIEMLVAAADLVKNKEETVIDLEGNHDVTLSNLLRTQ